MNSLISGVLGCGLLLFAAFPGTAETPFSGEAGIWQTAVAFRAESFTMAPGELPYEQYQLESDGNVAHRETGRMSLAYGEDGRAAVSIIWAKRDEEDFTAERARRLEKQASRRSEFLSFLTPFDPDVQGRLERKPGTRVFAGATALWQYEFRLPMNEERSIVGTARVREDGKPYDVRYTLSPLPWFLDIIEMHLVFDADAETLLFSTVDYKYEASFLFWAWRGGGQAAFGDWKRISAPPRLN
ncbi:MAG: hypothetical protein LBT33_06290 [Spirochaetia bacterium]|nr:hypothetical protein [Spirochaetia bacterium]